MRAVVSVRYRVVRNVSYDGICDTTAVLWITYRYRCFSGTHPVRPLWWPLLARSGVFGRFCVSVGRVGLSGFLCCRGLCFSLSILSAAGLPCSAGVIAYVVYCPGVLERAG